MLESITTAYENYDYQIIASELYQFTWDYFCDWYLEISKIDNQNKQETEKVLYIIFESLLRALHPVMPFVTEELWHQLANATDNNKVKPILLCNYPSADKQYIDDLSEQHMGHLMSLIRSIRNIRQTFNVPHSLQIDVIFEADKEQELLIQNYKHYVEKLSPSKLVSKSSVEKSPIRCASDKIDKTTIYIPLSDVIDIEKTKEKLILRKQSIEKEMQKTKQILASNEFKIKAPPEKVKLAEKQLEESLTQLSHLEAQLKVLN